MGIGPRLRRLGRACSLGGAVTTTVTSAGNWPVFPFLSLGSTEVGGSQVEGAVSPQTTMMLRACYEDTRWPRDPHQLDRKAENCPGAPKYPCRACSPAWQPFSCLHTNWSHLHPTKTLNRPDLFS